MPVMHIHLKQGAFADEKIERLMVEASALYAEVFECPIDRVRVFINEYPGARMAVAGKVQSADADCGAPFYEFIALQGRPQAHFDRLHEGCTGLIADILDVDRKVIRGACWTIPPERWAIAGNPAAVVRADEVKARQDPQ